MKTDYIGHRKVQVTRGWFEMVRPLFDKSKEDYELFTMCCMGFALRAEGYGDTLGFDNGELQALYENTIIRRWTPEKPALIDVKMKSNE